MIENRQGSIYELERQMEALKYSMDETVWIVANSYFYQYITNHIHDLKAHILSYAKNLLITEGRMTGANQFEIRALGRTEELEDRIRRAAEEESKNKPIIRLLVNHD